MYKKFILSGVSQGNSDLLNNKLKLSNQVAVILTVFCLLNSVSLGLINPKIIILPVIAGFVALSSIALRAMGELYFSRFILSISPMLLLYMHHGVIYPKGDQADYGFFMLMLSVSAFPFILFDLKEKKWLFPVLLSNVIILFTIEHFNNWLDFKLEVPVEALHDSRKALIVKSTAVFGLYSILLYLIQSNRTALTKNEELNQSMSMQNQDLKKSEEELKEMLQEIETARKQDQLRSETSEKLAEFAQLLRLDTGEQHLMDKVISFLVKSMQANQGGLYIVEGNEQKYIQLKACYAYERKKFIDQRIEIGEGLLGQAYLEKDKIFMTDIPQEYVRITSGLGHSTPTCLLIIPMIYHEEVIGLIELASFQPFEQHQIEMLEKAAENLASTFAAHRTQIQTRQLLEKSQMQAEELQSREEELRQNMEELQGTQEDMARREKSYLEKINLLESENLRLTKENATL